MSLKPFKYSLPSRKLTRSDQEAASLDALKAELRAEHQPANTTEEMLVNEIAEQFWRLRRARAFEANLLGGTAFTIPHVDAILRIATSAERGLHRALAALRRLQKDRGFVPQKQNRDCEGAATSSPTDTLPSRGCQGAVGFVSQKPEPALQRSA